MTRDDLIAARLAAARKFMRQDDIDWAEVERRIAADVDARMADATAIRDQSQPEPEDRLKYGRIDDPARDGNACGGGRRVIRKANGLS